MYLFVKQNRFLRICLLWQMLHNLLHIQFNKHMDTLIYSFLKLYTLLVSHILEEDQNIYMIKTLLLNFSQDAMIWDKPRAWSSSSSFGGSTPVSAWGGTPLPVARAAPWPWPTGWLLLLLLFFCFLFFLLFCSILFDWVIYSTTGKQCCYIPHCITISQYNILHHFEKSS